VREAHEAEYRSAANIAPAGRARAEHGVMQ